MASRLDSQTDTGPKLNAKFCMGEHNGRPSFILHTQKGFLWRNLPPEMENLIKMPNMAFSMKNFAIGPRGLWWYTYRSVNDVYEQQGSNNLWSTLNENWKGGCPIRLSFGPPGFFWGEKEWAEPGRGHLLQTFGIQPQSMIQEVSRRYPGIKSYEIDFVTIGYKGAWVIGTSTGDPCFSGISDHLARTIKRETAAGHRIRNVVLSPLRDDVYWMEYSDGTVDHCLPPDWDLKGINTHITIHTNAPEQIFRPFDLPPPSTSITMLRTVPKGDPAFEFVLDRFKTGWRHPHKQPAPTIHFVYQVIMSPQLHRTYTTYLTNIESRNKFASTGVPEGNQEFGWHGTRRKCLLGDDNFRTSFCSDAGCATCSILNNSFMVTQAGHAPNRNFLRFGKAIYVSAVSSKADDYASSTGSGYKTLILARIVKGKCDRRKTGDKKLQAPSPGFDCVEGLVGTELNYEETCLYHNDAVRPAYYVLYR